LPIINFFFGYTTISAISFKQKTCLWSAIYKSNSGNSVRWIVADNGYPFFQVRQQASLLTVADSFNGYFNLFADCKEYAYYNFGEFILRQGSPERSRRAQANGIGVSSAKVISLTVTIRVFPVQGVD